jgi:hypothetical protein
MQLNFMAILRGRNFQIQEKLFVVFLQKSRSFG